MENQSPYRFFTLWLFYVALGLTGLFFAWQEGYVNFVVKNDTTYFSVGIFLFFFIIGLPRNAYDIFSLTKNLAVANRQIKALETKKTGLLLTSNEKGYFARHVAKLLSLENERSRKSAHYEFLKNLERELGVKLRFADRTALFLMILGFLGTLIGIMITLSGFGGGIPNIDQIRIFSAKMINGLYTAFLTTVVGAACGYYLKYLCDQSEACAIKLLSTISEGCEMFVLPNFLENREEKEGRENGP